MNTQLTVAKICHEMANYLSILKFYQDDLNHLNQKEIQEVSKLIDLLSHTMSFFRNIYSPKIDSNSLSEDLKKIYKLKELEISDSNGILKDISENLQNVVSGVLYLIMKVSKPSDVVKISGDLSEIILEIPSGRKLAKNITDAILSNVSDDVFNVFINFIKHLASLERSEITISKDNIIKIVL